MIKYTTQKDKRPCEKQNLPIIIGIVLIASFYVLMFGSRFILPSNDYRLDLSAKRLDDHVMAVSHWTYNSDHKNMEIILSIDGSYTISDYIPSVKIRTSMQTVDADATIVAQGTDLLVIHINEIPRSFEEVRLTIATETSSAIFYNNINAVTPVDEIIVHTLLEYRIEQRYQQIQANLNQIEDLNSMIDENKKSIESYQQEILDIESQKKYLTSQQLTNAAAEIASLEKSINQLNQKNTSMLLQIEEYYARNSNIEREIKDLEVTDSE